MVTDSKEYVERYQGNYPLWCKEMLDMDVTEDQREADRMFTKDHFISIKSGTGTGKTCYLATLSLHFLTCYPGSKVVCTAPTGHQLEDLLFAEMLTWSRLIKFDKIRDSIKAIQGKMYVEGYREWYIAARTIPKDSKDKLGDVLAGFHAPYLLFIVDEASGVPDPVFKGLEGSMMQKNVWCVLASNPTRNMGFFFDTHHKNKKEWTQVTFSALRSPFNDMDASERLKELHGEDSDFYLTKVLGEFPRGGNELLVSTEEVYESFERFALADHTLIKAPLVAGLDPAAGKNDYSVLTIRKGWYIFKPIRIKHSDTHDLEGKVYALYKHHKIQELYTDYVGMGIGVYDHLRRKPGMRIYKVVGNARANDPQAYRNLRSELFCGLRDNFQYLALSDEDRYIQEFGELALMQDKEPAQMIPKIEIRNRLGFSNDYTDSLMLSTFRHFNVGQDDYELANQTAFGLINQHLRMESAFDKI
jgi:hypothetical protein